jgi:hypothetical protein
MTEGMKNKKMYVWGERKIRKEQDNTRFNKKCATKRRDKRKGIFWNKTIKATISGSKKGRKY